MNYSLLIKEEAEYDILTAYNWYESKQANLGNRFLEEIEEYFKIIERDPKIFQKRKNNLRFCPLKYFPYLLIYEIEDFTIIIYAVFNSYKQPL